MPLCPSRMPAGQTLMQCPWSGESFSSLSHNMFGVFAIGSYSLVIQLWHRVTGGAFLITLMLHMRTSLVTSGSFKVGRIYVLCWKQNNNNNVILIMIIIIIINNNSSGSTTSSWSSIVVVVLITWLIKQKVQIKFYWFTTTGDNYWVFDAERRITGPESLWQLGLPVTHIQAALKWKEDNTEKVFLFKSSSYWSFNPQKNRIDDAHPHSIHKWKGMPSHIDAAFRDKYGEQYVLEVFRIPNSLLTQWQIHGIYSTGPVCLLSESLDLDRDRIKISQLIFHLQVQVIYKLFQQNFRLFHIALCPGLQDFSQHFRLNTMGAFSHGMLLI